MNIGRFTKNPFSNDLGFKPNGFKRYLKPTNDIIEIEKKLASGLSVDDLSEEEYKKLNAFEKAESAAFNAETNKLIGEIERIALKIAKGEKLTPEEERLINENSPDLRREAEQAKKEGEELKKRLEMAKSAEEKQMLASTAVSGVGSMISKGAISGIQAQIKLAAIEKAIDESGNDTDITSHIFRNHHIKKGSFISKEA
ncbi:MAG: hypothetical protein ACRC2K_07535 [Clostridium sp.]